MVKTWKCAIGGLLASPFVLIGTASAQQAGGPAAASSPYAKCGAITDDSARLACFDETLAGESTRLAKQEAEQEERAEEQFGLTPAQVRARAEAAGEEAPVAEGGAVLATVLEVYVESRTRLRRFLLDNGQLWAEANASTSMRRNPKSGQQVMISDGPFGSFQLRVEGKNGFLRVKRLR